MAHPHNRHLQASVWRVLFLQAGVAGGVAMIFAFTQGAAAALSAVIAGVICLLANAFFVSRVFKHQGARAARQILSSFYLGEAAKLVLTALLIYVAIVWLRVQPLPFLVSFVATQMVSWFALVVSKPQPKKD